MNTISKFSKYGLALALPLLLTACADDNNFWGFGADKPGEDAEYEYLTKYDALKTYVNRTAHPDFKPSLAVAASEYDNKTNVYAVANANFDEIVAGNAMKMGSCVSDKGVMDFTLPTNFVNTAEEAGTSVYGHVLAWHSQQPVKWLSTLLADKELPTGKVTKTDYELDCSTLRNLSWNGCPDNVTVQYNTNGGVQFSNTVAVDPWYAFQYWLVSGISLTTGTTYKIKIEIGVEENAMDLMLNFKIGDWGGGFEKKLTVPAGETSKEIEFEAVPTMDSNGLFFQNNDGWTGTYVIRKVTITHEEASSIEVPQYMYYNDFTDGNAPGGWGNNSTREVVTEDGMTCIKINNPSATNFWSAQMAIDYGTAFENGKKYYAKVRVKGSGEGTLRSGFQITSDYSSALDFSNIEFTTDWKEVTLVGTCSKDDATRWIFSFGDFAGDIYISDLELYWMKSMNTRPLTDEEKKDTLTYAMQTWCNGMMNATSAKVKAWDLINEAVGQNSAYMTADGYYHLQGSKYSASSDTWDVGGDKFYWQDYFGEEDYGPIVSKAAQEAFVAAGGDINNLKLFVNDYNLEATWDNCKKCESLIYWINVWKSKGAKIDGIGTQMHISYFLDETSQNKQKECITNMFNLMAKSGLLCRVSELDMGIYDKQFGNKIDPSTMTFEQKKAMADYYQWIIEQYLTIIPTAQQYGICQWCATDSPAGSGWRAGEPVGLWTEAYKRKPTYGGWAEGLKK